LGCLNPTITKDTNPTSQTYILTNSLTLTYSDWTESTTYCGAFTYSALVGGAALPGFITFTPGTR